MRLLLIGALFLAGFLSAPRTVATEVPVNLRCEYLRNPSTVDTPRPRLSWEVRDFRQGGKQRAYQILMASTIDALNRNAGDIWDTGKVAGDQSINVRYAGSELGSREKCFWKVRTWDKDQKPSEYSTPAEWTMGLLKPDEWKGKWIGQDEPASEFALAGTNWIWFPEGSPEAAAPLATRWFRRTFTVPMNRKLKSAILQITGDNNYLVFINGTEAGTGGDFRIADTIDLTKRVREETNLLCIRMINGGDAPNPAGLAGKLILNFETGPSTEIETDGNWKCSDRENPNWLAADFDDGAWPAAKVLGAVGMSPWGKSKLVNDRKLAARWLRKELVADKPIRRATVFFSGLGLSELYVNGNKVGDEVLSPSLSEYTKHVFYVSHDVTNMLRIGKNAIGAVLGNGRFYAPRLTEPTATRTFGFPKLILQMHVEYQDGTSQELVSDESWKLTTTGPVRSNNEYDGEEYDGRMELTGWASPGFDDSKWEAASLVEPPSGTLVSAMQEPIRVTGSMKPIGMSEPSKGTFIFDMGQNMVGWCRLKVTAPAGTAVSMRFAETLQPDGNLYLANLRSAKVTDTYICKGDGEETWEPRFTYHGFRFVEVTGFPGQPDLSTIDGKIVNDDLPSAGDFTTSNQTINQLYHNVLWGVRGNYRSIPTDCPQRDERQGWTGDRAAESRGESYLFDNGSLYSKWVRDIADTQKDNGSVSDVCPAYWPMYNDNVTWPAAMIIIPGTLLDQFGDDETITKNYAAMNRWMDHMAGFIKDDVMPRDNYGDWCDPPVNPREIHSTDPAKHTAGPVLGTAYYFHCCQLMARYAELLKKPDDAKKFNALADRMLTGLNARYLNRDGGEYDNGTQTSSVLPLAFGMVPGELRKKVFTRLVDQIANESNNHIGTGLVGGQWLNRVLSDNGRADLAFAIATNRSYPGWGYMIDHGATTIWELWNGNTADPAMNSGNHVMLVGDLMVWYYEYLAGIRPDEKLPGFKHILLKPTVVGDLTYVKASHHSPYGMIWSEWHRAGVKFSWDVTIPCNSSATVWVPGNGPQGAELPAGTYHFESVLN